MSEPHQRSTRRGFVAQALGGSAVLGGAAFLGWRARSRPRRDADVSGTLPRDPFDLEALGQVDPLLIRYRCAHNVEPGLAQPRGVGFDRGGSLLVAGDRRLVRFDPSGAPHTVCELPEPVRAVAVDERDRIVLAGSGRLWLVDPSGSVEGGWELPGGGTVTSVAAGQERIWIAMQQGRRGAVLSFDRSGAAGLVLGRKDQARGIPGLIVPSPYLDVALGPDDLVWVANPGRHRVEGYTSDGALVRAWGEPSMRIEGFCGCCNPVGLAVMPDGRFVTAEKGLKRVKICRADGSLDCVVAEPALFREGEPPAVESLTNGLRRGLDVAAAADGTVAILGETRGRIHLMVPL